MRGLRLAAGVILGALGAMIMLAGFVLGALSNRLAGVEEKIRGH
jgi:hypothetical protein